MEFVVGQQLRGAREIVLQNAHGKVVAGALVGGDIVESLLKRNPVESRRSVGHHLLEHVANAVLSGRGFEVVVVTHVAENGDGGACRDCLDDQAKAVRQAYIGDLKIGFGDIQLCQLRQRPNRAARPALAGVEVSFSPPPKPFCATGSPEGRGTSVAVTD